MINASIVTKGFLLMSYLRGPRPNLALRIKESSVRYLDVRTVLAMLLPLHQCIGKDSLTASHIPRACPRATKLDGMRKVPRLCIFAQEL
jgi:hypothetical protein